MNDGSELARAAGFEPATKWLTATYSTAEPCPNERDEIRIGNSFLRLNLQETIHIPMNFKLELQLPDL